MKPSSQLARTTKAEFDNGLSAKTIDEAIAAPTLTMAIRSIGYQQTLATVSLAVTKGMAYFSQNRRLNADQIALFADEIISQYPHESLADISVFLRGASLGKYGRKGEEGETFGALDMQRLFIWFRQYLEQKAAKMERGEHELQQLQDRHAAEVIGAIPGLKDAVKEFVVDVKERSEMVRQMNRLEHLKKHLPTMTDDALRESWKIYSKAEERSLIYGEAMTRGLAQKTIDNVIENEDETTAIA